MNTDFYTFTREEIYQAFYRWNQSFGDLNEKKLKEVSEQATKKFLEYAKK